MILQLLKDVVRYLRKDVVRYLRKDVVRYLLKDVVCLILEDVTFFWLSAEALILLFWLMSSTSCIPME